MRLAQTIMTIGSLFACSAVTERVEVRAVSVPAQIESAVASLESAALAPTSGVSLDLSGIPTSVYAAISDPTAIASLIGEFAASPPAWYTSLTPAAQSYILAVGPKVLSIQTEIASLAAAASAITTPVGVASATRAVDNVTTTATGVVVTTAAIASNDTIVSTGNSTTSLKFHNSTAMFTQFSSSTMVVSSSSNLATTTSVRTSSPSSSSSSALAAQQTAALAASFVGAAGVLALAVAL